MSTSRTTVRIKSKIESSLKPVEVGDQMQAPDDHISNFHHQGGQPLICLIKLLHKIKVMEMVIQRKLHRISGKTIVIIDESLLRELSIEEEDIWFEETHIKDGIFLRICRNLS